MKNKVKITIINTVAINGGDEALLRGTINELKKMFPSSIINIHSNNPVLSNKIFNDISFDWDWEHVHKRNVNNKKISIIVKIKKKLREKLNLFFKIKYTSTISLMLASSDELRVLKKFKQTDFFILAPGGYIHDFYSYDKRIETCMFIKNVLKKDYHIFSQSIGPFWKNKNNKELKWFFNNASSIVLRESISRNHIKNYIQDLNKVKISTDVAFTLVDKYRKKYKKESSGAIVMCFRQWKDVKTNKENLNKAVILCKYLITELNLSLNFISTCQGIDGYVNDSVFAKEIVNNLPLTCKKKCIVNNHKYSLEELIIELSKHDAYIGMRLHGAILSMIGGIPALNIGYEDKTLGIYKSMALEDFCFSYDENIEKWLSKTNHFVDNRNYIKMNLNNVLDDKYNEAIENFDVFKNYST